MKHHSRAKSSHHLIWLIPALATMATLVAFLGVGFAALFRWMGTLKVQRRAMQLYVDSHLPPDPAEETAGQEPTRE